MDNRELDKETPGGNHHDDNRPKPNPPFPPSSDDSSSLPKLDKGKERARDDSQDEEEEEDEAVDLEEGDFGSLSLSPQELRELKQAWKSIKAQKAAEIQCKKARKAYEWQQKCKEEDNEEALRLRDGNEDEDLARALQESMMDKYHPPNQLFPSSIRRPHSHKQHSRGQAADLYHHRNSLAANAAESQELGNDDEAEDVPRAHHEYPTVLPQANPSPTSASRVPTPSSPTAPSRPRRPDQQRYTHPHRRRGPDSH